MVTNKDLEDCSRIIWDECAGPARKHLVVSHLTSLLHGKGSAACALPEGCVVPMAGGRTQPGTSATSTSISHLLASFCLWYQVSCWADVSQHWGLGWGSCLPFSALLWSNNYEEAGENTGLGCDHMAMWKFIFPSPKSIPRHSRMTKRLDSWMPHSGNSRCSYSLNVSFLTSKARRFLDSFITGYLQASFYLSPFKKCNEKCC